MSVVLSEMNESRKRRSDGGIDCVTTRCCRLSFGSAEFSNVQQITLTAPASSCYAGAKFQVGIDCDRRAATWNSQIYHPLFTQGGSICSCISKPASSSQMSHDEWQEYLEEQLLSLISVPELFRPCSYCSMVQTAWCECQSDVAFFKKKAQSRTIGAFPLSDQDLRGGKAADMDFSVLLKTGLYSDFKIVAGGKSFNCHRTVLASASPVLAKRFQTLADGGVWRLPDVEAKAMAFFLKWVYCRQTPG